MRSQTLYLRDILESINLIEEFVEGLDLEGFKKDIKTSDTVIKRFENIGEATKSIPEDVKTRYNEVPWKEMAGMRDILIHSYFGTEFEAVWLAAKTSVPELIPKIEKLLKEII